MPRGPASGRTTSKRAPRGSFGTTDLAVVRICDGPHDGQAEAPSLRTGRVAAAVAFEDRVDLACRHARPVVRDGQHQHTVRRRGAEFDGGFVAGVPYRVGDQLHDAARRC